MEHVEVRRGEYHDSVTLMQVSLAVNRIRALAEAQVVMGTRLNLDLLAERGFDVPKDTGPSDLVIAIRLVDHPDVPPLDTVRELVADAIANALDTPASTGTASVAAPRTTGGALARNPAELTLVSVPGEYAFVEAVDALRAGSNVMVFSDNVPVEQEVALKREATERGLIVLGPDAGTSLIDGAGLGFSNVVGPGPVSIVAASGTGAQQLVCLLAHTLLGVRHVIGVGGRDLTADVGGISTGQALEALRFDWETELAIVVTKPPDESVLHDLVAANEHGPPRALPIVWAPVRPGHADLTSVAEQVLRAFSEPEQQWPQWQPPQPLTRRPGKALRGLFCGGTLCTEAAAIAGAEVPAERFSMTDFGEDTYTRGRPHPMIDPTLRTDQFVRDAADPDVGVVLLDVVLGYGSHPDPADDLAPAIMAAEANVVVSLIGARGDPQDHEQQARTLAGAGACVFLSNAAAAKHAVHLVS